MFYTGQKNIKLTARNEGKIKSYDSCVDVRAWSHDSKIRSCYLRDWMKSDMPICVIPAYTVTSFLNSMTLKNRGKVTPRCHPECRSKAILESICTSCHAIKECFRNEEQFEKYFEEEEFETSHWPCERCLEALKSIKMFWKIITEKIFNVLVPVDSDLYSTCNSREESVRNVAKVWEKELVQQALYIRKSAEYILKPTKSFDNLTVRCIRDVDKKWKTKNKDIATETISIDSTKKSRSCIFHENINKCTSVIFRTVDFACNTTFDNKKDIDSYKNDLEYLQQKFYLQNDELGRLKRENVILKLKLKNTSKTYLPSWHINDNLIPYDHDSLPRPFETCCEEETEGAKDVESEMIITLKNGKNEDFKHVSMLQVLHKTNTGFSSISTKESMSKKQEDPLEILTRVHNTFEEIVKREMYKATENNVNAKKTEIDVSYHKISDSRSIPSCVSANTNNISSSKFVSTSDVLINKL